jgi:putative DNA primase/helicase
VERTIIISDKSGWVNASFLTPAKTYGNPDLCFRDPEPDHSLIEFKGALEEWKSSVAAKCEGNSRLIFALGCAFAAPMLDIAQIESGGFHLVGGTSIGKTTALNLAASVAGIKSLPNWRSTANALEGKAMEFNHMLLPLDEIGQADPISVGAAAYMLGNGQGKNRMGKTLATIKPKTWELLFLSTGEVSMEDYLGKAGLTVKGGMETRMPSFPADAGAGYGVFENLHGHQTAKEFVQALESAVTKHRGHALDFFLSKLVEQRQAEGFDKEIRDRVHKVASNLSQQFTESSVGRVAIRLALVQVGLEMAHDCNLLPFPIEQCGWAIEVMLADWLNLRGGAGSIEVKAACNRIEYLFVSSQLSDRIAIPGQNAIVRNLLAWKMGDTVTDGEEYLVPPAVFDRELAAGVDREALVQELVNRGWLKPSTAKGRYLVQRRVNGSRARFFAFRPFWVDEESQESFILPVTTVPTVTSSKNGFNSTIQNQRDVTIEENLFGDTVTPDETLMDIAVTMSPVDEKLVGEEVTGDKPASGLDSNEVSPLSPPSQGKRHIPKSIYSKPEDGDVPAPCSEGACLCQVGGILRRIRHRVKGQVFNRIDRATIESSSQDGWWVKTPTGDRLHVSNEAIAQGWWEVVA